MKKSFFAIFISFVLIFSFVACSNTGVNGSDGIQGPPGATGPQGPQGEPGKDGENGSIANVPVLKVGGEPFVYTVNGLDLFSIRTQINDNIDGDWVYFITHINMPSTSPSTYSTGVVFRPNGNVVIQESSEYILEPNVESLKYGISGLIKQFWFSPLNNWLTPFVIFVP
jgi:hypothetical protein